MKTFFGPHITEKINKASSLLLLIQVLPMFCIYLCVFLFYVFDHPLKFKIHIFQYSLIGFTCFLLFCLTSFVWCFLLLVVFWARSSKSGPSGLVVEILWNEHLILLIYIHLESPWKANLFRAYLTVNVWNLVNIQIHQWISETPFSLFGFN